MTPNKLPPMPESRVTDEMVWSAVCAWRDTYDAEYMHSGSTLGNDEQAMRAALEAAEAIRQSQSLPAGAVADDRAEAALDALDAACRDFTNSGHPTACVSWIGYMRKDRIDAMRQALQADAREKGEAWPGLGRLPHGEYSIGAGPFRIGISYDSNDCTISVLQGRKIVALMTSRDATQPAQASEADNG